MWSLSVKKHTIYLCLMMGGFLLIGQQDPIYSQLSFNILQFNPGYTGSRDAISGVATYRTQWTKIDGQPQSFNLGIHTPLKNKISLGANFAYDEIGISKHTFSNLMAAYRINFESSFLQFGMQAGLETLNSKLSSIKTTDINDPAFASDQNINLFNIGAGLYYSSEKLYLGLSLPTLLSHKNYYQSQGSDQKRYTHLYGLIGYVQKLNDNFIFRPSMVTRWSSGTTLFLDLNASIIWNDLVWAGISYKTSHVMVFMTQLHLKGEIFVGYSYDLGLANSVIKNSPTHEVMLGIDVPKGSRRFSSPRYF